MKINLIFLYGTQGRDIMKSNDLSPVKRIKSSNISAAHEVYQSFKEVFLYPNGDRKNRVMYKNEKIYFNENNASLKLPNQFWHIISRDVKEEKFITKACVSISNYFTCYDNCSTNNVLIPEKADKKERFICFHRLSTVHWIPEIIKHANNHHRDIKTWYDKKERKEYIWFKQNSENNSVDYVIVLRKNNSGFMKYRFITAFPIIYPGYYNKFNNSYNKYKK